MCFGQLLSDILFQPSSTLHFFLRLREFDANFVVELGLAFSTVLITIVFPSFVHLRTFVDNISSHGHRHSTANQRPPILPDPVHCILI